MEHMQALWHDLDFRVWLEVLKTDDTVVLLKLYFSIDELNWGVLSKQRLDDLLSSLLPFHPL